MDKLTITQPDDWHLHLRTGAVLQAVIAETARQFGRAIIMPNLKPAVTSVAQALAYRQEILAVIPSGSSFQPLMTLYLTGMTRPDDVKQVAESGDIYAFKLYPAGATTNSDAGVSDVEQIYPVLAAMEQYAVPLLVHGEVTDEQCDIFDRERVFIERHLQPIVTRFPGLRVVMEHVTTKDAVDFVLEASPNVAATITPQHLLYNRNAMLVGGIKPHFYCLPILKRESHRQALLQAATSGSSKFFLGTDSAPHLTHLKENKCGCAGCFNAPVAMSLYAEAFEQAGKLDRLEAFASFHGADFYGLPRNRSTISLSREAWQVPDLVNVGGETITPLSAGETLRWRVCC